MCGCFGIVYQACSFSYYGEHKSIFWELFNVTYHNSLMSRNPKLSKSAAFLQSNRDKANSQELRQFRYIKFMIHKDNSGIFNITGLKRGRYYNRYGRKK